MTSSGRTALRPRTIAFDLGIILSICCVYAMLVRFFLGFPSPVEDSYILFRYASHLGHGTGLTWNPGTPRDQGMTGIAWALLLGACAHFSSTPLPQLAGVLGIATGALCLAVLYVALRRALPTQDRLYAAVGSAALAFTPVFERHSGSGMETILTFLAFALTVLILNLLPGRQLGTALAVSAFVTAATFLVRPDAALFPAVAFSVYLFFTASTRKSLWAIGCLGSCISLVLLELLVLGSYFTTSAPLPVYIKSSLFRLLHSPRETLGLIPWIASYQLRLVTLAAVWLVLASIVALRRSTRFSAVEKAVMAASACFFLYLFTVMPLMNFAIRYQSPLLVPIIYLGIIALVHLKAGLVSDSKPFVWAEAVLCIFLLFYSYGDVYDIKLALKNGRNDHMQYRAVGQAIRSVPSATIASTEAGILAFYSDAKFFDLFGLNSTFVATHYRDSNYVQELDAYLEYTFGYPDIYVRPSQSGASPYMDLCTMPSILNRYEYLGAFDATDTITLVTSPVDVFLLRDGPRTAALKAAVPRFIALDASRSPQSCAAAAK